MSSFFDRMFGRKNEGSSSTAKDRLQFVLVHDRINLPPERMQEMKEEILAVISKYVTVDRNTVDIALEQRDRNNSKLIAEIPVAQRRSHTAVIEPGQDNSDLGETEIDEINEAPVKSETKAEISKTVDTSPITTPEDGLVDDAIDTIEDASTTPSDNTTSEESLEVVGDKATSEEEKEEDTEKPGKK